MAKKTASKKTASKKKRTAAQKRATEKLVAMNKKKRASKKKASARTGGTVRKTRSVSAARPRGYPGGARRTNPNQRWSEEYRYYAVVIKKETGGRLFLGADGYAVMSLSKAVLFPSQSIAVEMAKSVNTKGYNWEVYVAGIDAKFNKADIEALYS